jgi:hypothetical protein
MVIASLMATGIGILIAFTTKNVKKKKGKGTNEK